LAFPAAWKARGLQKKYVLRRSQAERLPANILNGPKDGFDIPYDHWLRTSLHSFAKARLLDPGFCQTYALQQRELEKLLDRHRSGQAGSGFLLWKLLQLALWDDHRQRGET
jgi:asparagine synthase (glutamine-hydrolysing)